MKSIVKHCAFAALVGFVGVSFAASATAPATGAMAPTATATAPAAAKPAAKSTHHTQKSHHHKAKTKQAAKPASTSDAPVAPATSTAQ